MISECSNLENKKDLIDLQVTTTIENTQKKLITFEQTILFRICREIKYFK
jgi:hypothetical protein